MVECTERINEILNKYPAEQRYAIAILHDIQNEYGYISADSLKAIADYLGVSVATVFANLTFYDAFTTEKQGDIIIQVCDGTVCHSKHSSDIIAELEGIFGVKAGETTADGMFTLKTVNCMGACGKAPIVVCNGDTYGDIQNGDAEKIVEAYKAGTKPDAVGKGDEINILESKFEKVLLKPADSIEAYIAQGGYEGLKKALAYPRRRDIITEVKASGLRGRSGSGFPVGAKWEGAYNAPGRDSNRIDKYVVANGDEGDPGSFMDRWLMEESPYAILEGLTIAGCAIGASKGFIYIRDEYLNAIERVQKAIDETRSHGLLGKNVLGSGFNFDCEIVHAARSYVCGEEGALMESIEGRPGVPRVKPPFPTIRGVLEQPTIINNVETLANVPLILKNGGEAYAKTGIKTCTGTKLFSLAGKVKNKGLVEIPMGSITLRQLIYDIGGGMEGKGKFKCIQTGGPSGGYITEKDLDLSIDFDSISKSGSLLGSGGIVVLDDTTCAVDMAKYMIQFLSEESCGTCTPCREGLRVMRDILTRITEGKGEMEDLELLEEISFAAGQAARCVLGKTIGNPVMTTLKHFRNEYEEHIRDKKCRADVCESMKSE